MRARAYRALYRPRPIGTGPDTITIGTEPATIILIGFTTPSKGPDTPPAQGYGPPTDTWLWLTYRHCMGLSRPNELGTSAGTGPDNPSQGTLHTYRPWVNMSTYIHFAWHFTETGPTGTGPHHNYIGTAYGTPTGTGQDTSLVHLLHGVMAYLQTLGLQTWRQWAIRH